MKKARMGILFAFVCFISFCSAYVEESTAFSIIRQHLLTNEGDTSILSKDKISAITADLTQNGYPVSDREYEEDAYVYDVTLDILESVLDDYYDWSIQERHEFDQMMVDCGELSYCHNLLPGDGEISQEDALRIALNEIANRYDPEQSLLDQPSAIYVSYYIADHSAYGGMWRFGIDLENQMSFDVEVTDGSVTRCQQNIVIADLEKEYTLLCQQRGAFFKWSLQEKMEFADSLPQKLARAKEQDALLRSDIELEAIAAYGFCLPTDEALSQEETCVLAATAMEEEFGITRDDCAKIYYSFFFQKEEGYVWRVIFWNTGNTEHTSVIVDMQASTGDILSIKSNGNTASKYIPYIERL